VQKVLERLVGERGAPEHLRSDNGPEFIAKELRSWLAEMGLGTFYIKPGSPWQNAFAESLNNRIRDELLNQEVFNNVLEARILAEEWRRRYNRKHPHSGLGLRPPTAFAGSCADAGARSASPLAPPSPRSFRRRGPSPRPEKPLSPEANPTTLTEPITIRLS
jgi:putative transposase